MMLPLGSEGYVEILERIIRALKGDDKAVTLRTFNFRPMLLLLVVVRLPLTLLLAPLLEHGCLFASCGSGIPSASRL